MLLQVLDGCLTFASLLNQRIVCDHQPLYFPVFRNLGVIDCNHLQSFNLLAIKATKVSNLYLAVSDRVDHDVSGPGLCLSVLLIGYR